MIKKILVFFAILVLYSSTLLARDITTVFYFYSNTRCPTCFKLEKYTLESLKENFQSELASDKIVFKPINVSEPKNKHYLDDYQLYTKSVVLDNGKGKWKNLDQIWYLVRNKEKFNMYIYTETKKFMENK